MTRAVLLVVLVLVALLPACRKDVKPGVDIAVVPTLVGATCGTPPAADPFTALPVVWKVQKVAGLNVFTLTAKDYQNLMTNLARLLTTGRQVQGQRDFYVACIERFDAELAPPQPEASDAPSPD